MTTVQGVKTFGHEARRRFGDRAILPNDPQFASSVVVWNGMVDKLPAAVVRCADATDVRDTLILARDWSLPVSVRGGGHQVAGASVVTGGVVIDLGAMRHVTYQLDTRTLTVGGGALLGDLDRVADRYSVAVPAGVISHTGVGGLTLGGGIGWLSRSRGLTCDSLVAARMVDATGRHLRVTADDHPDLFWALRGGGGNFGVVTEFDFRSRPITPVTYGVAVHTLDSTAEALAHLEQLRPGFPRELQVLVRLQRFTGHNTDAADDAELVLTVEWLWSGDQNRTEALAGPLGQGARTHRVSRRRFIAVQSQQDHRFPHGRNYYVKPGHLSGYGAQVREAVVEAGRRAPVGDVQIEILLLGGAISDVEEAATAFPRRDAVAGLNVSCSWTDTHRAEPLLSWARDTHGALTLGGSSGAYVNFAGQDAPSLVDIYGRDKLDRLQAVKDLYDPEDVFVPHGHVVPTRQFVRGPA